MRHRFFSRLLLAALLAAAPSAVSAHPLDVSATTATVKATGVDFVTYLHSYEAELLLARAGVVVKGVDAYLKNESVILDSLRERVSVSASGAACPLSDFSVPEQAMYQILSVGLETRYSARCPVGADDRIAFRVDLFPDLPLQTNRLFVYDARASSLPGRPNASYVLTPRIPERIYDRSAPSEQKTDADRDGLADEDERTYRTDPHDPDTDADHYSDYEEAMLGWNPLDERAGPGQIPRDADAPFDLSSVLFGAAGSGANNGQPDPDAKYATRYIKPTNLLDSSGWGQGTLVSTLKRLDETIAAFSWSGLAPVLASVALLGFLHALGPGHAKSLLAALVADRRRGYFEGFLFTVVFTVTHLIDIVLLFAVTRGVFWIADPTAYMASLQMGATAMLFAVGTWLVWRSVRTLRRPSEPELEQSSLSAGILTGFVAGLAPCTFGWSLFLLLFSLGRLDLVLPVLAAFGVGIFACLWLVMTLVYFLRVAAFRSVESFARWSSLASGAFILCLSLWLASSYVFG